MDLDSQQLLLNRIARLEKSVRSFRRLLLAIGTGVLMVAGIAAGEGEEGNQPLQNELPLNYEFKETPTSLPAFLAPQRQSAGKAVDDIVTKRIWLVDDQNKVSMMLSGHAEASKSPYIAMFNREGDRVLLVELDKSDRPEIVLYDGAQRILLGFQHIASRVAEDGGEIPIISAVMALLANDSITIGLQSGADGNDISKGTLIQNRPSYREKE